MMHLLVFLLLSNPYTAETQTLVKEGDKAKQTNNSAKAATIYEAARILSPNNKIVLARLADLYLSAGRNNQALDLYQVMIKRYCDNCKNNCYSSASCSDYRINAIRIKKDTTDTDRVPLAHSAPKIAKVIFKKALAAKKKRRYKQARDLLQASLKLNPDYVGVYRHLGEVYSKLKNKKQADDFYLWYLKTRPAGPNAARVRKRLSKKTRKKLGKVKLEASYKCNIAIGSALLTNSRGKPLTTPVNNLTLPKGRYAIGFICQKQNLARRFFINVIPGKKSRLKFKFGTLSVKLRPWARILIAPKSGPRKGRYMDAGLFDVIGLPEGSYTLKLVAFNKSITEIRNIKIRARKKLRIRKWRAKKKRSRHHRRKK